MKLVELDQSGPDWHKWRAAGLGASDAATVLNENPFCCADELLAEKTGKKTRRENARMRRGKDLEPLARVKYMEVTGIRCRPICVVHDRLPWLRASLDGLSEDNTTILEIKCPSDKVHQTALDGNVPTYYYAQTQHQLAVTGCRQLHYWSYTDSKKFPPERQFALVRVEPDPEYIERLIRQEARFWERLQAEQSQAEYDELRGGIIRDALHPEQAKHRQN